ncbi:MAG: hypothetical protein ACRDY2_08835 [Acidimicrobiales bacterium]
MAGVRSAESSGLRNALVTGGTTRRNRPKELEVSNEVIARIGAKLSPLKPEIVSGSLVLA